MKDRVTTAFLVLFAVSAGLSTLGLLAVIIYVLCKKQGIRYIAHFCWNLLILITILLFLIAALYLIIGLFAISLPSVISIIFYQDNLTKILGTNGNSNTASYLNVCLNGNFYLKFRQWKPSTYCHAF